MLRKFILIFAAVVRLRGWSPSGPVIKCAVTGVSWCLGQVRNLSQAVREGCSPSLIPPIPPLTAIIKQASNHESEMLLRETSVLLAHCSFCYTFVCSVLGVTYNLYWFLILSLFSRVVTTLITQYHVFCYTIKVFKAANIF